jgi:AAA+ ATPase superfamily predicted ATPase
MARFPFTGRERELQLLQQEWESDEARMLILYGRRRVGKTRLITHWIDSASPRALYWVAEPTSSFDQLRSFSQALFSLDSGTTPQGGFSYASWKQAFEQVERISRDGRLVLVLDEFTYWIKFLFSSQY